MSEENTNTDPSQNVGEVDSAGNSTGRSDNFTPIETKEDFEKAIAQRVARERGRFSDYDELKSKAEQFDKLEEEKKSELEKLQEKLAKAEEKARASELSALKSQVAEEQGVPAKLITGSTQEEMEESAKNALEWLASVTSENKSNAGLFPSPTQGRPTAELNDREALAELVLGKRN